MIFYVSAVLLNKVLFPNPIVTFKEKKDGKMRKEREVKRREEREKERRKVLAIEAD